MSFGYKFNEYKCPIRLVNKERVKVPIPTEHSFLNIWLWHKLNKRKISPIIPNIFLFVIKNLWQIPVIL